MIICTWNRAKIVDQTLTKMRDLEKPPGAEWELVVVNNRSTDSTEEVLRRHARHLPLRSVMEPKQGLCRARNRGIAEAQGELVVWTDDDASVDQNWLLAYASAARRWPEAAYFGGPVCPWYEHSPPAWMTDNLDLLKGLMAIRYWGTAERPYTENQMPFGPNMAFRRRVFDKWKFNVDLGLVADSGIRGEEWELFTSLRNSGELGVYVPDAKVSHLIQAHQMTRVYLWKWAYGYGRTLIKMGTSEQQHSQMRLRFSRLRNAMRYRLQSLSGNTSWVRSYYHCAVSSGMIHELNRKQHLL